ncbi:MAG: hypothetical protein ACRD0W_03810 [Acidimicrobiales bacterium]
MQATLLAGALVGASAAVYTLASGRSPAEVGRSGEATLEELATAPERWSVAALLLLLVCKGVAYGVSLGPSGADPVAERADPRRLGQDLHRLDRGPAHQP